ncbi:sensor histidine kinase [Myroides sp. 1354]|uniref:sensor histidine kinase n=1 Tax=unclassified Myroides TaxID=2642485 RepID=UPI00257600D0|nr:MULTISPECIES: ATP-binding protein [unclassified Myroides]MDM1044084.1 sensor histidine kinase [Myroides sp. R163-1]MDM1055019.1 sensor histidine kinase [Myroides sp. 1354]MDM1068316.1 sensor histidine kinase [Myroides sp. 1372]
MSIRFKRSYKFAVKSALLITICSLVITLPFVFLVKHGPWPLLAIHTVLVYFASFFVIQYRVEHFIYRRIKKIYDKVSLLEHTDLRASAVTTDMKTLTEEIEKFATNKKIEIESLQVREEYRREFLGNISHELKTPLFMIQSYLETLSDGAIDDLEVRDRYLERAEQGVDRLIYIVKDLDMIAKLESGDLHLNIVEFDLIEMIQNAFDFLEYKAKKKNISLLFDMGYKKPIYVKGDKERIGQVITNLIENSIKYGKEKGTTEVSIENLVKNKLIVRVTDNGLGIRKEHIPRLFERFYRIDKSGARSVGGSGLGLSIVKHIVEAHDEHIYVESSYGYGSEFSFTLEKAVKEKTQNVT